MRTSSSIRRVASSATISILAACVLVQGCGLFRRRPPPPPPYWVVDLGPLPGGRTCQAQALNDAGAVVGCADFADNHGHSHAVVWDSGKPPRDLGTLDGGGSQASRISGGGIVVGRSSHSDGGIHATVFDTNAPRDLGTTAGSSSMAFGVDDAGHTLIAADTPSGEFHSYLQKDAQKTDIGALPGYRDTVAGDLNSNGTVVGTADNGEGGNLAFEWKSGRLTSLAPPAPYTNSFAAAVNGVGEIAGHCSIGAAKSHAVVWTQGQPTELSASDGKDSEALALNDSGDVVGMCNNHACLWRGGKLFDLNNMIGKHGDMVLHEAVAINNHGQIACNGTVNKQIRAYLLTPSHKSG